MHHNVKLLSGSRMMRGSPIIVQSHEDGFRFIGAIMQCKPPR